MGRKGEIDEAKKGGYKVWCKCERRSEEGALLLQQIVCAGERERRSKNRRAKGAERRLQTERERTKHSEERVKHANGMGERERRRANDHQ